MNGVIVVKMGGATFGGRDTIIEDIVALQKQGQKLVVVHGGGNLITEWLKRQGTDTRFVRGERVTDRPTLDMVVAVLGGLVNKEIVAAINNLGGRAVGISGVDGGLIVGQIKDTELGYAGAVKKVNTAPLKALLDAGYVPVVSPLGLHASDKPGEVPQILNINGDPVAGEIAAAIGAEKLIFLTDVPGIRDQSGKFIARLAPPEAKALVASGVASGGMIPKIEACLKALKATTSACIIDGRDSHALVKEVAGQGGGTVICR